MFNKRVKVTIINIITVIVELILVFHKCCLLAVLLEGFNLVVLRTCSRGDWSSISYIGIKITCKEKYGIIDAYDGD